MYSENNIETLTPEEFAAKYLPALEQRDAASSEPTPTTYFMVGFERDGIYSTNIITANTGSNDLAAVTETAERRAARHGYKVAYVEAKPESYVNECRAKGMPVYPIDEEARRKYAPSAGGQCDQETPENYFVRNRETGKLELHFDKADYDALTDDQKREIKGAFLWGRKTGCWISRAKEPNLYHAERIAQNLGLYDAGKTGERLSFAEQQQRKAERAERRADRFDHAADVAATRCDQLQKPIRDMHGDIAFFTQPNINTSGGRAFTRRRDRMFAAFEKGFEEYRKSEHYRERAETARRTANQAELQDKGFIVRRIRECESAIRKLKKNIESYETTKRKIDDGIHVTRYNGDAVTLDDVNGWIENDLDKLEAQLDKLGYYQDALDALGGVTYSQENIKPGYMVRVKSFGECRVMSTGPKNFTAATEHGMGLTYSYAEITEIVSDQGDAPRQHPFKVGEAFKLRDGSTHTITRVTAKTVTLSSGDRTYRVTPKYIPVPSANKWMWALHVGSGCWGSEIIYRD